MDWHSLSPENVLEKLGTRKQGLTAGEVHTRLGKYGRNTIKPKGGVSPLRLFLDEFRSLLILILLASAVALFGIGVYTGEPRNVDAILILIIVMANGIFGFVQNYKAEKGMEALRKLSAPRALVIRDGKRLEIDSEDVVPGDIVVLEEGCRVPADCRVLESKDLHADESILTGESLPVWKRAEKVKAALPVAEMTSMLFMDTSITRGRGLAVVVGTGFGTEVGKIAAQLEKIERRPTRFQLELDSLGRKLALMVAGVIALIAGTQFMLGTMGVVDIFITAVALAVAAIPEGLPAVVTLSLALGSRKMFRKDTMVRKLPVVESLGSVDTICTDKTGTLTENKLTVQKLFFNRKKIEVTGVGYSTRGSFLCKRKDVRKEVSLLLKSGVLCNNANCEGEKFSGDPTELALLVSGLKAGLGREALEKEEPRVDEIAFSSDRKIMTTVHRSGRGRVSYTKGAPEVVLEKCNRILLNGKEVKLTGNMRKRMLEENSGLASRALRVLGFSYRKLRKGQKIEEAESDMVFLGLQAMIDPPRKEVKEALKQCRKAGIRVVVITGDNPMTAKAIGGQVGLTGKVMTGQELDNVSAEKIGDIVESVSIFARVNPEHKVMVLKALQDRGHLVAMTGDGVNDAPALKKADVGIAMGIRGTDVAKGTSDMVLMDDNFATIVDAIGEGRTIFDNIRKFVNYLLTCNIAEVLTVFILSLMGHIPITAVQLLWINLITDGPPALALGADPSEPGVMERKPRPEKEGVINRKLAYQIVIIGAELTVLLCAVFMLGLMFFDAQTARTMVFTGFIILEFVRIATIRWQEKLSLLSNKWLLAAIGSSLLLQLLLLYSPLGVFFGVVPLGLLSWGILLGAVGVGWIAGILLTGWISRMEK